MAKSQFDALQFAEILRDEAGVDFTDVEAAKTALARLTAELEQVKAERDRYRHMLMRLVFTARRTVSRDPVQHHVLDSTVQEAEAVLGEKGQQ